MGSFLATPSTAAAAAAGIGCGAVGFMIHCGGPPRASTLVSRLRMANIRAHIAGPRSPYPVSSAIVQFTTAPSSAMSKSRALLAGFSKTMEIREADGHSEIFDEIFDGDESSSPSKDLSNKFLLSDLIRQNSKAFVPHQREKEQMAAAGSCQHRHKDENPCKENRQQDEDINSSSSHWSDLETEDDSDMEEEVENKAPPRQRMLHKNYILNNDRHGGSYNAEKGACERDSTSRLSINDKVMHMKNGNNSKTQYRRESSGDKFEELGSRSGRSFQQLRRRY